MQVISNGSKWAGQEPDSVETLIALLSTETLDPTFEAYGDFYHENENGTFTAFGNFLNRSHVFNIVGTAEELEPLRLAIEAAKARPSYLKAREARASRVSADAFEVQA
jgi:hypothetical protein